MKNNSKPLGEIKDARPPRAWQIRFISHYFALLQEYFLLVATPGSGKTVALCRVTRRLFEEGRIDRIVVVVHSEHLKFQWAKALSSFGIEIDPKFQNGHGREASDYHGAAVTYQQVSKRPALHAVNCEQSRTLVVYDEPHHNADDLYWGEATKVAFDAAEFSILATGTPFRSDEHRITFVRYENGESVADFSYAYGEALADEACRQLTFSVFDGYVEWIRRNGQEVAQTMSEEASEERMAEMLQVALSPTGEWLPAVLRAANDKLSEMRADGHPEAAGIVFARDIAHAGAIADILRRETGEEAMIVTSDEEGASQRLKDFNRPGNRQRFIVSVRMVIEGVDIARLRVGVFATNILSELFFRQLIGRIIRMIPGLDEQTAVMYLPYHPVLIDFALKIREERDYVLSRKNASNADGQADGSGSGQVFSGEFPGDPGFPDICGDFDSDEGDISFDDGDEPTPEISAASTATVGTSAAGEAASRPPVTSWGSIIPVSSEAIEHDTIHNGEKFSTVEMTNAEMVRRQVGALIPPALVAAILRAGIGSTAVAVNTAQVNPPAHSNTLTHANGSIAPAESFQTRSERKAELRGTITQLTNKLAFRLGVTPDLIHRQWIEEMGGQSAAGAEETDLIKKLAWIKGKLSDYNRRTSRGQKN